MKAGSRMLREVQSHNIPIVLQVAGDEAEWTTPLAGVEALLKEFPCIKAIQVVEWRCATRWTDSLPKSA